MPFEDFCLCRLHSSHSTFLFCKITKKKHIPIYCWFDTNVRSLPVSEYPCSTLQHVAAAGLKACFPQNESPAPVYRRFSQHTASRMSYSVSIQVFLQETDSSDYYHRQSWVLHTEYTVCIHSTDRCNLISCQCTFPPYPLQYRPLMDVCENILDSNIYTGTHIHFHPCCACEHITQDKMWTNRSHFKVPSRESFGFQHNWTATEFFNGKNLKSLP